MYIIHPPLPTQNTCNNTLTPNDENRYNFDVRNQQGGNFCPWRIKYYAFLLLGTRVSESDSEKREREGGWVASGNGQARKLCEDTAEEKKSEDAEETKTNGVVNVTVKMENGAAEAREVAGHTAASQEPPSVSIPDFPIDKEMFLVVFTSQDCAEQATRMVSACLPPPHYTTSGFSPLACHTRTHTLASPRCPSPPQAKPGMLMTLDSFAAKYKHDFNLSQTKRVVDFHYCNQCHDYNPWRGYCANTPSCSRKMFKRKLPPPPHAA